MAEQLSLYKYSGKLDNTVGNRWKANRAITKFWAPRKKKSVSEMPDYMQRQVCKFSALASLAVAFTPVIAEGLKTYAKGGRISVNNAFSKLNKVAISAEFGTGGYTARVDWSKLVLTQGRLPMVLFSQADFSTPQTVKVSFGSASGVYGASEDDKVYVAVYCPTVGGIVVSRPVTRDAGELRVTLPDDWNGLEVKVWGWAVGGDVENMGRYSETTFLGSGTVN